MTDAYVQSKAREAILAAKGSRTVAQQLLMQWAQKDQRLLLGMAQPFLQAIAAAALQGEMRRIGGGRSTGGGRETGGGGRLSRDALGQVLSRLGDAPPSQSEPRTAGSGVAGGGMRAATMTISSKAEAAAKSGDVDHEKAMMAIAKAFAAKKF